MRIFSYRNKQRVKTALIAATILLAILMVFCLCRFVYLQRFLIYSNGVIQLDYDQDLQKDPNKSDAPWDPASVQIITEEPAAQTVSAIDEPMKQLTGFYITTDMLQDMDKVNAALDEQDEIQTVMVELKSRYGNFYYSSGTVGAVTSSADIAAVDNLIDQLQQKDGIYLIARIASLSDNNFALAHQTTGLPLRSGALWMDTHGCYWLDPMATSVQEYLVSIAQELAFMGFDEVVFDEFWIPDSTNIIYRGETSREEAAGEAAKNIRSLLATDPIRISFNSSDPKVAAVSDRVYLKTDDGSAVTALVEGIKETLENPTAQVVFQTASRDTRFNGYGLLRPLIEARSE